MLEVILASNNQGKVEEVKQILTDFKVYSLKDLNIDIDVDETGATFEENAILKATEIGKLTNKIVIADDSGLIVDKLPTELGVKTARFMGDISYSEKIKALTQKLEGVEGEDRSARFVCSIACYIDDKNILIANGTMEGYILKEPRGDKGFAFDPIFLSKEKNKSNAEMTADEKNEISHRSRALKEIQKLLTNYFNN